ncbi:hypothetical protein V500_09470 [Pseudogymnoascus sp. VKM F-4518 (FW-2643)]|nr:hypothetical protein V500_09470 [Pseudogymnoascus sp. VKM F-4518 (FW-2643)]
MELQDAQKLVLSYMNEAADQFQKVPGSAMLIRYVRSSYQNDPVRSAIELILVVFFVRYLLAPSYSTHRQNFVTLSEEEIDDLVDEWTPEPLVAPLTAFEENVQEKLPVIVGMSGPKSKLANGRTVTNLASYNYYNLVANEHIREKAIETLRTYGVGPCGPPQFYGTQDVHMKTEADVASHLGMEACIVYAQSFSTISSVIPAFSKRGDIIVADKACNYAIRKGLQICRSTIRWYEHNDMEDLERVLQRVVKEQSRKPLTRRFIVTEGLFETVGDCVDLPKVVELRLRYKFRLILDETWSFGVLGRTGRGVTEAQNVDSSSVDMIVGSLSGPLCAGGGFCAGSIDIVEHQRISAAAYTFSAALPAMMATTASEALLMLQTMPEILAGCRENIKAMLPCKRRPHHAPQGHACRAVQHGEGAGMAATARAEGVRHDGADEEGDGEGGRGDPARGDEGDDAEDEQEAKKLRLLYQPSLIKENIRPRPAPNKPVETTANDTFLESTPNAVSYWSYAAERGKGKDWREIGSWRDRGNLLGDGGKAWLGRRPVGQTNTNPQPQNANICPGIPKCPLETLQLLVWWPLSRGG